MHCVHRLFVRVSLVGLESPPLGFSFILEYDSGLLVGLSYLSRPYSPMQTNGHMFMPPIRLP